eukprot:12304489-Ditylum_brightwellii.AAC.1
MKASKKYQKKLYGKKTYKFGIQVPMTGDVKSATKLDKENRNNLWFDAQKKEVSMLRDMATFELMLENFDLTGYQYVSLIYAWDVKFDGRRRACLVANGKVTIRPPEEDVWSVVVNTELVRTAMPLNTKEMMYSRLGPEFRDWA